MGVNRVVWLGLLCLAACLLAQGVKAEFLESFEEVEIGRMPPGGWLKWEEAGGRGWSNSWAGRSPMPGWMSGTNTVPPDPAGGSRMAYVTYTHGGAKTNDLWLITPVLKGIVATSTVSFWYRSSFSNFADNIYVWISTNPAAYRKSNFSIQAHHSYFPRGFPVNEGGGLKYEFPEWSNIVINIGALVPAGTDIKLGFQEFHGNNWYDVRANEMDVIRTDLWGLPVCSISNAYVNGPYPVINYTITFDGSETRGSTESGLCWGPNDPPTVGDYNHLTNEGNHHLTITNINFCNVQYFRSYVKNIHGTFYSTNTLTVYPASSCGEGYLFESFEDVPIGEMPPSGWKKWEEAGGRGWSNSWAGRYPMPGWMSGTNTTPPCEGAGSKTAYVTYTHGGAKTNDLWLISPPLRNVSTNLTLDFWYRPSFSNFADSIAVWISTKSNAYRKSDFSTRAFYAYYPRGYVPGATGTKKDFGCWTNYIVDIGSHVPEGSDIHVAFQEYHNNNWYDVRANEMDCITVGTLPRQGLKFDGTDDRVLLPLTNAPTSYTLEAWVKPDVIGAQTLIVRSGPNPLTGFIQHLRMNGSGNFEHYTYDGVEKLVTGTTVAQVGKWYHVAGSCADNGNIRLIVNGKEEGTALAIGTQLLSTMTNVYLGVSSDAGNYPFYSGELDEIRFWDKVRTTNEIAATMNVYLHGVEPNLTACYRLDQTHGTDLEDITGNHNSWMAPCTKSSTFRREAYAFNGVDNKVIIPLSSCTADYTVGAWVYPRKVTAQNIMVATTNDSANNLYLRQLRINSSGQVEFYSFDGVTRMVTSTTVLSPNQWYYIVGYAENGISMKLYINGAHEGGALAGNTLWRLCDEYVLGGTSAQGNYPWFDGFIRDVLITNIAMDPADILANYTNRLGDSSQTPSWIATETPLGNTTAAAQWNPRGLWQNLPSGACTTNGLTIETSISSTNNYIIFGDNNLTGATTDNLSTPPNASRLSRIWYAEVNGAAAQTANLVFHPASAGCPEMYQSLFEGGENTYNLLWRSGVTGNFVPLATQAYSVGSSNITFNSISVFNGYYTLAIAPPNAPAPLAATNVTAHSFHANWSAISTATNYYLDVAGDGGFTAWVAGYNNRLIGDVQTCLVTGLTEGTPYFYRLRAQHVGAVSTNSGTITATTLTEGSIGAPPISITTPYATNTQQSTLITNSGESAFHFASAITYGAGASNWLSIAPAGGTVDPAAALSITSDVHVIGINVGTYYATNTITSPTATNSPYTQTIELTIIKADQTISFPSINTQLTTNVLNLAASASSGLAVSFSIGDGPASIADETNVTFTTSGTVEIIATQTGNENYNAAPAITNTFTVNKSPQAAISFTPTTPQTYNTTNSLSASGGSGGGVFSYTVLSGPGTIIDTDKLKATSGINTIDIKATKASDAMYLQHSMTAHVACAKAAQLITFPAIGTQLTTNTVNLAATSDSGLSVSFTVGSGPASIADGTNV
ncbi:MAG: choice-of-anchor J domain-containing protein, partial [Kiritimatiellae bacterium]|nr:choice-of-anchor J domain-containing protein [Kiritimatiellia bacterium]